MVSHNLHVRKRVQHVVVSLLTLSQYNVRRFAIASVNTSVAIAREQSHTMQQSLRIHQTSKHFQNYNNIVMMSYVIFGQQVKQHVADTLKKNMKSEGNEKPESAYNKNEAV